MADESLLNKINNLMRLAMDPGATEAERALAMQRADALRLKHTVEDYELRQQDESKSDQIRVEEMRVDLPAQFASHINHLVGSVARHCNLRVTWRDFYCTLQIVGFKSDIEYFSSLWVVVYSELARNLFPSYKPALTFDHNVYNFVKGGYKWQMIAAELNSAGVEVKWPDNGRLKRAYHRWCKEIGEEPTPHTQRHDAFRISYVRSYQSTVTNRLYAMSEYAKKDSGDSGEKFALAVKDNRQRVDEQFYKMYPQYDPEVIRKRSKEQQEAEDARRAAMTQEERDKEDAQAERDYARARKHADRMANKEFDRNGWSHGRKVGSNVDLSLGKNAVAPNRTEIEG